MKRLLLLLIALSLTLTVFGVSAQEDSGLPVTDLTDLAAYAPETTAVYASVRFDEGYLAMLDGVLANLAAQLPEGTIPPGSLSAMLEQEIGPEVYPLLGDQIAVYIPALEAALMGASENPAILVFEITDKAGVDSAFEQTYASALQDQTMTRTETEDGSIYYENSRRLENSIYITDNALIVGVLGRDLSEVITPGEDARNLTQSDTFTATMDALPADAYDFVGYFNPSNLIQVLVNLLPAMIPPEEIPFDLSQLNPQEISDAVGQFSVAGVIHGNRSFVLDLTSTGTAFAEAPSGPVDLALLDRVPADTPLLIQGKGLGDVALTLLDSLTLLDQIVLAADPTVFDEVGPLNFGDITTFLRLSFEGTYGLNLEETLSAFNGDFVSYLTANFDATTNTFSVGSNTILRTSNPENTQALLDEIATMSAEMFNPTTYENGVLNVPLGALFSQPAMLTFTATLTDDLLIVGDPADVDFALNPGDGLTSTDQFAFEAANFLPDTTTVWYLDSAPLSELITGYLETNAADIDPYTLEDLAQLQQLLTLIDTVTITTSGPALRLTLTLNAGE